MAYSSSLTDHDGANHAGPLSRKALALAALAGDGQLPVATLGAERLDAGAGGLRNLQPVQGEQGDESVLRGRAEFVAVQPGGTRLVVQAGPAGMGGR